MKFAIAALAAATTANAFNTEFVKGAQTGMFLKNAKQIEEFECHEAVVDPDVQKFLAMVPAMQMMMGTMNKGAEPLPMIDIAVDAFESYGKISYLFDSDFEGTDFCKGLLFAHEASKIIMELGREAVSK